MCVMRSKHERTKIKYTGFKGVGEWGVDFRHTFETSENLLVHRQRIPLRSDHKCTSICFKFVRGRSVRPTTLSPHITSPHDALLPDTPNNRNKSSHAHAIQFNTLAHKCACRLRVVENSIDLSGRAAKRLHLHTYTFSRAYTMYSTLSFTRSLSQQQSRRASVEPACAFNGKRSSRCTPSDTRAKELMRARPCADSSINHASRDWVAVIEPRAQAKMRAFAYAVWLNIHSTRLSPVRCVWILVDFFLHSSASVP